MMGHRSVADVQLAGDFLVTHALAYLPDDLILASSKRCDPGLSRWEFGRLALHQGAEHTMGQSGVKAKVSLENFSYRLGNPLRRALLQQDTFCPVAQRRFVKINAYVAGKDDHFHVCMEFGDAMQLLREIFEMALAPEQNDLGLLLRHLREQVGDARAFRHHDDVVTGG